MSWFTSGGSRPAVHGTTTTAAAGRTATVYRVSGMTCGHCRTAITKSVGALDEVVSVDVDVAGGLVTVTAAWTAGRHGDRRGGRRRRPTS